MPTASQVNASAGDGSTSVTVPADATMAVAFWSLWHSNTGVPGLLTLTLGGNSFTIQSQINPTGDKTGVGVATLTTLPAAGSQTLAWDWQTAPEEGGELVVVWVTNNASVDPIRDFGTDVADDIALSVSTVLDTETTDLIFAFGEAFASQGNPNLGVTAFINNALLNAHSYDVAEIPPSTGITVDKANIGATASGVTSTTYSFTTTQAVATGARIIASINWIFGGGVLSNITGGGLAWELDHQEVNIGAPGAISSVAYVSALAPYGLAAGTTITFTLSIAASGASCGGASFFEIKTDAYKDGTPPSGVRNAGSVGWATNNVPIVAGSLLIGSVLKVGNVAGHVPAAGVSENWEVEQTPEQSYGAAMVYRIEGTGGSYSVGGDWTGVSDQWSASAIAYLAGNTTTVTCTEGTYMAVAAIAINTVDEIFEGALLTHNVTPLRWR